MTGQPSMALASLSGLAGDSCGTVMDEVALAYTDPFPILMTHRAHDGIFTLLERRKKLRIEPVAPPGRQVPSLVAAVRTLRACSRSFLLKRKCRDEKELRQRHQQREI